MQKIEFTQPEFLFCEIPIKDDSIHDHRIWVYHRLSLSLIEFVNVDDFKDFDFKNVAERFEFENCTGFVENYFAIFIQNNCEATDQNEKKVLKNAWNYLKNYFEWEDNK